MNRIVEEIKKAGTFYLATVEGDQPRVRPFGSVTEFEGQMYLCTNSTKEVYKQMIADPTGPSRLYKLGDGIFEVFRLENPVCTKCSFGGAPEIIEP